ncbi:SgcJ/EcaC family oxidoreductase [Saccharopolyspora shandongensis]|uniref:YybH family protein n=1 Tax=Saccharopolyspora shandongensis TaxID=418495 RepID=UPI0034442CFA
MAIDENQIRTMIEWWAAAVHAGDMTGVLADHAADIVMFDVPPPENGVRGLDAYRSTWPDFFRWQAQGAVFEIDSLEVTLGSDTSSDVAYAHALLRCGTPEELAENPDRRLRLTLGLRKENGRWVVAHEHHSFTHPIETTAEAEVRTVHQSWFDATARKDLDRLMAHIAADIVSYEHDAPLQYVGVDAVREVCRRGLDWTGGAVGWDVPEMTVLIRDDLAVVWGLNRMHAVVPDGTSDESWSRGTRVFRKRDDRWEMVHQHVSFPYAPETDAAVTALRP